MGFITKFEMGFDMGDYEDCDSDIEIEMDRKNQIRDERVERIKNGIEHNENSNVKIIIFLINY